MKMRTQQNIWGITKAMLRGKFIATSASIKKIRDLKKPNSVSQALRNTRTSQTQSRKKKERIKIRAKINRMKTKTTIKKDQRNKMFAL
jgi:5-carboxymethyl-2-hydroxymuconate isomerase